MYQFQREITWMVHACPYQLNNVDGPRTSAPIQQRAPSLSWRSPCPIGVTRFELAASTSLTWRATSCATPRNSQNMPCSVTKSLFFSTDTSVIIRVCIRKSKGLFPLDFRRYKAAPMNFKSEKEPCMGRSGFPPILRQRNAVRKRWSACNLINGGCIHVADF